MKVTFVNPGEYGEGKAYGPLLSPHMGVAYMASYIKHHNHDVEVIEMPVYQMSYDDILKRLKAFNTDVLAITARSFNILSANTLATLAKKEIPNIKIVLGGAHATALPRRTLQEFSSFDCLVVGYGEIPLLEFVQRLEKNPHATIRQLCHDNKSFVFRDGSKIIENPIAPAISDLDSLPNPDYSMYDMPAFGRLYHPPTNKFHQEISMFASRGCPYKCTFCMAHGGEGVERSYNFRSPANVVDEIEEIYEKTRIDCISFNDSTFGIKKEWFLDFCHEMMKRGLQKKLHWSFETRANLAKVEILETAVKAGCKWIFFGFESGSEKVLKAIHKGITPNQIRSSVRAGRDAKVPYLSASFIVGMPGETRNTIAETASIIEEIKLDTTGINIAAMYPGTELYTMIQNEEGGMRWADPSYNFNWDIYDRKGAHIAINDLEPIDLENYASKLRNIGIKAAPDQRYGQISKSVSYMRYYFFKDRQKLWYHVKEGVKGYFPSDTGEPINPVSQISARSAPPTGRNFPPIQVE